MKIVDHHTKMGFDRILKAIVVIVPLHWQDYALEPHISSVYYINGNSSQ